jgi:asparagine synthase (glutamine-hydrolysing)
MFRYLALVWNKSATPASDTAVALTARLDAISDQWRTVIAEPGLTVCCADERSGGLQGHRLNARAGAILGYLFDRNSDDADDSPAGRSQPELIDVEAICNSSGIHLVARYWGNYVAILREPSGNRVWLIKDPTGSLPCCVTPFRDVTIIFSCLADCLALGMIPFTVNWSYVERRVAGGIGDVEQCALNEVRQVFRGELIQIDRGTIRKERRFVWNPLSFSNDARPIEDVEDAARTLRNVLRSCTHTLAAGHRRVMQRLSGGLDSSIILGCLRSAPTTPDITAYTYYNPHGRSDERKWARLAAQAAQCRHFEVPFDPLAVDLGAMSEMQATIEPLATLPYLLRDPIESRLAEQFGCTAIFSGEGGDSGFGRECCDFSIDEYLARKGLGRHLFRVAANIALHEDLSVWTVLIQALRRKILGSRMSDLNAIRHLASTLVAKELREPMLAEKRYPHPWFNACEDVPWPTVLRLGMLLAPPEFYDPFLDQRDPALEHVMPLYAQPVVEACLRIPTYVHFWNGRDRALARKAFAPDVPQRIARREWKDRAPGWFDELTLHNLDAIRSLLLDGILMRRHLLDRAGTEQVLSGKPTKSVFATTAIFNHLEIEIWLRKWEAGAAQRMAA